MAHRDSVRTLASILRPKEEARPVLLLGAGASFSSGVPLAAESVKRLARRVFAERVLGASVLPEQVKVSEWQAWLQSHDWFVPGEDRLAENFPLVVGHLLQPRAFRSQLLMDLVKPTEGIGAGYRHLAQLVMRGLTRTILTTNFDTCLNVALQELRAHIPYVAEVNRGPDDFREFELYAKAQIVWLHGKAEQYTDRNDLSEIDHLSAELIRTLVPLLGASPIIVIGYRGAEPSVMQNLLSENAPAHKYKKGVFWCRLDGEPLHPRVESFRQAIGANFRLLEIDGFDALLRDLDTELVSEDFYLDRTSAPVASQSLSFDDQPLLASSVGDLDQDLMLSVMRKYCAHLRRSPVTSATLSALLREQGLLKKVDGVDVPTHACYLLFARNPSDNFPHAVVSATVNEKKRTVFRGNLITQRDQLLEWLRDSDINPVMRVKGRATHEQKPAYPERALVELLVNLLVHRDYSVPAIAQIDVRPSKSITFTNPGRLPDVVAAKVPADANGTFRPVPNNSFLRNRALCDVFFGLQAMEREGTGLLDVERMALETGGAAVFRNDAQSNTFTANIQPPAASTGSLTIANDYRVTNTYVLNVLPIGALPDRVFHIRLRCPLRERPHHISLDALGVFVSNDCDLWTFEEPKDIIRRLSEIIDTTAAREVQRAEFEANRDTRRILAWLIRKHFDGHVRSLEPLGLQIELRRSGGNRAYFAGCDGAPRLLFYDTPRRKRIPREVVKQRNDGPSAWFENEGFGYEVVRLDETWGIRVKPFYMFTGRDALTPLPAFTRTKRATRRMKFDRNKNVEDDLTFWGRFLGQGMPTINLGSTKVQDLIVESAFLRVDVAEEGLVTNETHSRVSA